jgi:hypothetical protein
MQQISENMGVYNEWYDKASKITIDELPEFLNKLMNNYHHDYGTICHALAAGSIATAWAMNNNPKGGITGFQAGAVMWEFIRHWMYKNNKTGLRLLDYDNFLYPQYDNKFDKTIDQNTWKAIQKEAQEKISKTNNEYNQYLKSCEKYKIDIEEFVKKYPDYYERKKYYDKLTIGTGKEWEEEKIKEENGFEFAPREPFDPRPHKDVYRHWQSIVNGKVPFGYRVVESL